MTTIAEIPYGTQLSFWDDYPSEKEIVFAVTYCVRGCPFHSVFEAKGDGVRLYVAQFKNAFSSVMEPTKYLLAVHKNYPQLWNERTDYYVADDYWEVIKKIEQLTGRYPLWKMSIHDQDLPSNYATQGPRC